MNYFLFHINYIKKRDLYFGVKDMLSIKKIAHGILVMGTLSQACAMEVEEKKEESKNSKTQASDQLNNPNAGKRPRIESDQSNGYLQPIGLNNLDHVSADADNKHENDMQLEIPSAQKLEIRQQHTQQQIENTWILAESFFTGKDKPQNFINAAFLYQQAAQVGSAKAQNKLGMMLWDGKGLEIDKKTAAMWFFKSAQQGYFYGQINIASAFSMGLGIPQNFSKAVYYFEQAQTQSVIQNPEAFAAACFNYAIECQEGRQEGRSGAVDNDTAIRYLKKAIDNGHPKAAERLRTVGTVNYIFECLCQDILAPIFYSLPLSDSLNIRLVCKPFFNMVKRPNQSLPKELEDRFICYHDGIMLDHHTIKAYLSLFPNLTKLNLQESQIQVKEWVTRLTGLTSLNLSENPVITNDELSKLKNLTCLYLNGNELISNPGIKNLTNLVELDLHGTKKISGNCLKMLTKLKTLKLGRTAGRFANLDIKILTNLTVLNLEGTTKIDNGGIENLTNLTDLNVSNTKTIDADGIEKLTNLISLTLPFTDQCKFTDGRIAVLTKLKYLHGGYTAGNADPLGGITDAVRNILPNLKWSKYS